MNVNNAQSDGLRIVLCTLNSKFSHTSLAVRLLREACRPVLARQHELILAEYTINDQPYQLLQRLFELKGDIYAFSCYIWNSQLTRQLIKELGCLKPEATIIIGGPEAAWQQERLMDELPQVKFILAGEGEFNLPVLLAGLTAGNDQEELGKDIPGVSWRDSEGRVIINPVAQLDLTAAWPFAYNEEELKRLKDRILYYESSRGCPFGCTYCMSSRDRKVRYRDLETVITELERFMSADVKLVKFVDRTFNCDPARALSIWRHLIKRSQENTSRTRFHFEIAADLLDDAAIELLSTAPEDLFQFEIGVQTCNHEVLKLIDRSCNLEKLFMRCKQLRSSGLIHQHLDLIAGLPGDNLEQMTASFNQVMTLDPHMLQLGFLKVLPGSIMSEQAKERGMLWRETPPYEILCSDKMSFEDLLLLKRIENQLDRYYNNESFVLSISYLLLMADSPYLLFATLAQVNRQLGWEEMAPARSDIWELPLKMLLAEAATECFSKNKPDYEILRDCLIIDYISSGQKDQPGWQRAFELSQSDSDLILANKIRERNRQDYPGLHRIRIESFTTDPIGLQNLRELIKKHGMRHLQGMENAKSDKTIQKSTYALEIISCLRNRNDCVSRKWYAVFDMTSPRPKLIWQFNSNKEATEVDQSEKL